MAEPPVEKNEPAWQRHDLHIVIVAFIILILGWAVQRRSGGVETKEVGREGVRVSVPATWLVEPAPSSSPEGPLVVRGEDAVTHLEIRREEIGSELVSVEATLDLARARRYGDLYQRFESGAVTAGGTAWKRVSFAYAFKPSPTHAPRVASAVEYAAEAGPGSVVVVTLHASEDRLSSLEQEVLSTLHKDGK